MANLRMLDMQVIDDLFQRPDNAGYVLDFSDRTFAIFFAQELDVDIDDPIYSGRMLSGSGREASAGQHQITISVKPSDSLPTFCACSRLPHIRRLALH